MARLLLGTPGSAFVSSDPGGTALISRVVATPVRYGPDRQAWQVEGRAENADNATTYTARQATGAIQSLTDYSELRFWLHASRAASGSGDAPVYAVFEIGRGALTLGSWPVLVSKPAAWELARLDLSGLADRDIDWVGFRWSATAQSFRLTADDLMAVAEAPFSDADDALLSLLDGQATAAPGGNPIAALLWQADLAGWVEPEISPYIRVIPHAIELIKARMNGTESRGITATGQVWLAAAPVPYDIRYAIDVVGGSRSAKNRLYEFILATLAPERWLWVNSQSLLLQWELAPPSDSLVWGAEGSLPSGGGRMALHFRLSTWLESGERSMSAPVLQTTLLTASQEDAGVPAAQESSKV